jgi:ribosomal protein S18 acetylase RimI-like enzyme
MNSENSSSSPPDIRVDLVDRLSTADLNDICDAAEAAILDGGGFGWLSPPDHDVLEAYWRGVILIPERHLLVGRLDGVIAGSCQILVPTRNNEAQSFACNLTTNFVAPWARGHGLSAKLIEAAEEHARSTGFQVLNLDVRETQIAAIRLYERLGYVRFGSHPHYARVAGRNVAGHFYYKTLVPNSEMDGTAS